MAEDRMTLSSLAGVMDLWERRARWKSSSRRRLGSMAEDQMTLPMFAGVLDLLKKQKLGLSSAEGDTCKAECYASRLVHGSQPSAG
jgi:hypothetical protein